MTPASPRRSASNLPAAFRRLNRTHGWFRAGDVVLVALSGGLDSTALLDLLADLARTLPLHVEAATVDHGLRPFHREFETTAVLCALLSVPHHVLSLAPGLADRARASGASLQEAARRERYQALGRTAETIGATSIATAHHADDQAETLLLRLASGAGLDGLKGVLERRGDGLVRPLLRFHRSDLESYVAERRLPFVEDPTNRSGRYTRNRVRSDVMPALASVLPGAAAGMARSAALLAEIGEIVDQLLDERLDRAMHLEAGPAGDALQTVRSGNPQAREPGQSRRRTLGEGATIAEDRWFTGARIVASALGKGPLRRMLLHRWLLRSGLRHSASHIRSVEKLLDRAAGGSASVDLPGGWQAHIEYGDVCLERQVEPLATPFSRQLPVSGIVELPEGAIAVEGVSSWTRQDPHSADRAAFDVNAVAFPLIARSPARGDRLQPEGAPGSRLLSDVLGEARIVRRRRPLVPVIVDGAGRILWVAGVKRSTHALPVAGQPALVLSFLPGAARIAS